MDDQHAVVDGDSEHLMRAGIDTALALCISRLRRVSTPSRSTNRIQLDRGFESAAMPASVHRLIVEPATFLFIFFVALAHASHTKLLVTAVCVCRIHRFAEFKGMYLPERAPQHVNALRVLVSSTFMMERDANVFFDKSVAEMFMASIMGGPQFVEETQLVANPEC